MDKKAAPRNKTIRLTEEEIRFYSAKLVSLEGRTGIGGIVDKTINQDFFEIIDYLPGKFADLLILDPPYNIDKIFNSVKFKKLTDHSYAEWFESFFPSLIKFLKDDGSIYVCSDWLTSVPIYNVLSKYVKVRNRITWEREKGRGSKKNWKNNTEDIWFCTLTDDYTFNVESVLLKKKVIAPYRDPEGRPKDWIDDEGGRYRLTYPSNIWTDISVPFWSMPENTEHPTQKPEKLIAKLILASTDIGQIVMDPFLGSGTTSVVAKKLNRRFVGIEKDPVFACLTEKRLRLAEEDKSIQGYADNIFWERNTLAQRKAGKK